MNIEKREEDNEWNIWFYGPPETRPKRRRTEDKENEHNERINKSKSSLSSTSYPNTKNVKYSLFEESLGCFNVFKRQRDALQKKFEEGHRSRVFSFEHPSCSNGGRRFLVTTVERFWRWYESKEEVAFYELIPDQTPVRLFFDLEFYRISNPDANEKDLITEFNLCLSKTLKEMFQLDLDVHKHMLILDASTPSKFSEHIIIHLPDFRLFPSCVSIKPFVGRLEKEMIASNLGLVFNADGTKKVTICDTGVYTLNRNFRLYRSSKMNKNNPLKLASRCKFYSVRKRSPNPKKIFLDSLVVPPYQADIDAILENVPGENDLKTSVVLHRILEVKTEPVLKENYLVFMSGHEESSPFPVLEHYILDINRKWRTNVSIRTWKLSKNVNSGHRIITYYLSGCRFCFNIGREHRSNGVYWVVDLEGGFCYQKCFDVDCRGTSSNHFPLPRFIRDSIPSIEEVEKATVGYATGTDRENSESVATLIETYKEEKDGNAVSKSLSKIRRRSALLEKIGALNASDSFYDVDDDERLLEIVEEFENKGEFAK